MVAPPELLAIMWAAPAMAIKRTLPKEKTFRMILYRLLLIYTSPSMPEGGMARYEAAGIHIDGGNKWKTLIQAAAKPKSDD